MSMWWNRPLIASLHGQASPPATFDWVDVLARAGLSQLDNGRGNTLVLIGPRADHDVATPLWNPSLVTVLPGSFMTGRTLFAASFIRRWGMSIRRRCGRKCCGGLRSGSIDPSWLRAEKIERPKVISRKSPVLACQAGGKPRTGGL